MKQVLLVTFLTFSLFGFSQDCQDFKTGTFKVKLEGGTYIPDYKVIRRKKIQMEKSPEGYIKSKVVWLDDCTYQLIHIKSDHLNIPVGNKTTVKILKTYENSYDAIGTSEAVNAITRVTLKRI